MTLAKIQKWRDEFDFLDENDRLMYIIDLAKNTTSLPKDLRTEDRLVRGCMSQIWIDVGLVENTVKVYYDSDAMITKGITSIICDCFSDITLAHAKQITKEQIETLGIRQLLTAQRRNGLSSLVDNIQKRIAIL
jgi:cysteine desulfuration protein SufE